MGGIPLGPVGNLLGIEFFVLVIAKINCQKRLSPYFQHYCELILSKGELPMADLTNDISPASISPQCGPPTGLPVWHKPQISRVSIASTSKLGGKPFKSATTDDFPPASV